ncbi:hypothetical protein DTL42_25185 [Bremerella cremea]|uniref:Uncharacterized protein n=1 Tax=Bremerella cremea TaxID=1031537 RepID=A0A368KJD0_9BACT|nr:hypothetical protein [Bremerella cremea]RCS40664.1 hypothetical protein DTL42_25185 [Bremerella cremea]
MRIGHATNKILVPLMAMLLLGIILPCCALADVIDDFESAQTTWVRMPNDANANLVAHQRKVGDSHFGASSELISLNCGTGTHAYFGHPVPPARVVTDLKYSVWVKTDRQGIQVAARVVFPRAIDPQTGYPRVTLVFGDRNREPNRWNALGIRNIDEQVRQQVAALRSEHGAQFDQREAYVDYVVLNLYTKPGPVNVQIDQLEGEGMLNVEQTATITQRPETPGGLRGMPGTTGVNVQLAPQRSDSTTNGQVIEVNDHPEVPRIIDYNGEPLGLLRRLGFTAIRTSQAPSSQLQKELLRYNMWSVSSPPEDQSPADQSAVLAWELPVTGGEDAFSDFAIRASDLRLLDGAKPRPILAITQNRIRDFSQHSDVIATRRTTLGTSQPLEDYAKWMESWGLFASPNAIRWGVIPTQFSPNTQRQVSLLAQQSQVPISFQPVQLEKATFLAVASGVRGVLFESNEPLNAEHPTNAARGLALELINRRLDMIEPWVAAGRRMDGAECSDPNVHVSLMATDTAILLIAVRTAPQDHLVIDPIPERKKVTVRVRGVPMASEARLIGDSGIHWVEQSRGLGDMQIHLDQMEHVSLVVLTQDQRVIRDLYRRSEEHRAALVKLRIDIAQHEFNLAESVRRALESPTQSPAITRGINQAWAEVREAERMYEAENLQEAYRLAVQAENKVARVQKIQWQQLAAQYRYPLTNPTLVSYDLIPFASRLQGNLQYLRPGGNILPGGAMEDPSFLLSSGWVQERTPQPGFNSEVEFTPQEPHGGNYAVAMRVKPDAQGLYARPEQAPIAIRSAPVRLEHDRLVLIRGWIRIPKKLSDESGGVLIHDSLGGRELGLHLKEASEWTEFTLIRATGENDTMLLTFELADQGEVFLDDVTVQIYEQARGPEIAPGFETGADDNRFQTLQP